MLDEKQDGLDHFLAAIEADSPGGFKLLLGIRGGHVGTRINATRGEWQRTYRARSYRYADPVVAWGLRRTGYRQWTDLERADTGDPGGFFQEAGRHGIAALAGIAVAGEGARSILELVSEEGCFAEDRLAEIQDRLAEIHRSHIPATPRLTPGEAEALRRLADGASIGRAARDIGISESAVKLRLASARKRLGVPTTLAALHKAAQCSLI